MCQKSSISANPECYKLCENCSFCTYFKHLTLHLDLIEKLTKSTRDYHGTNSSRKNQMIREAMQRHLEKIVKNLDAIS